MDKLEKFNPFEAVAEDDTPATPEELTKAKLMAGVVSEEEHLRRMSKDQDPHIRGIALRTMALHPIKKSEPKKEPIEDQKTESQEKSFREKLIEEYCKASDERKSVIRQMILSGDFPKKEIGNPGKSAMWSYGAFSFSDVVTAEGYPSIIPPDKDFRSYVSRTEDLAEDVIAFGSMISNGRHVLIFRKRKDDTGRYGSYPFTILLDPGQGVWEKFGHNSALIAERILSDPILKDLFFSRYTDDIKKIHVHDEYIEVTKVIQNICTWIMQNDNKIKGETDQELLAQFQCAISGKEMSKAVLLEDKSQMPSTANVAKTLSILPEEIRKNIAWMIGGGTRFILGTNTGLIIRMAE